MHPFGAGGPCSICANAWSSTAKRSRGSFRLRIRTPQDDSACPYVGAEDREPFPKDVHVGVSVALAPFERQATHAATPSARAPS